MTSDPTATSTLARPRTDADRVADDYFDAAVRLSPIMATNAGIPGHEEDLDDVSPAGRAALSALRQRTLAALTDIDAVDDVDRVTISALRNRLELDEEIHAAGFDEMSLNVIASPLQDLRDVFDLMPQDSEPSWTTFATRMTKLPTALGQYQESLLAARDKGRVAPRRQVTEGIQQCTDLSADDGYFATLVADAKVDGQPLTGETKQALAAAAAQAANAYRSMGEFLRRELLDAAPEEDACGIERYRLMSRYFVGATVDLEETYRWGIEECARLDEQMRDVAERIRPGATVKEAIAALEADPAYQLQGKPALKEWMQTKADDAIAQLADVHFDIPGPMRTVECMIAPTEQGGIYYTPPSDDFSRPGRMWWSVPKGITTFGTWKELTTVYHEGVPGHHLQCAQAVLPVRAAQQVAPARPVDLRSRRGLGSVCRAPHGRARLHGRPGSPDGLAGRSVAAGGPRGHRHRRALRVRGPRGGRRRRLDLRQGLAVPHQPRQPGGGVAAVRAEPLPRLAGSGAVVQDRRAPVALAA